MIKEQHFYTAKAKRIPKPEWVTSARESLLVCGIPWGNRDATSEQLQKIADFFIAAKEDSEATSPFPRFLQYSNALNNLQIAMQLANQNLIKTRNHQEYQTGMEIFACYRSEGEFGWACFGGPHLLLQRPNGSFQILQNNNLLSSSYPDSQAPLPKHLLGIHPQVPLHFESIPWQKGSRLFLLYSSTLGAQLPLTLDNSICALKDLVDKIQRQDPDQSFWLAELELG